MRLFLRFLRMRFFFFIVFIKYLHTVREGKKPDPENRFRSTRRKEWETKHLLY